MTHLGRETFLTPVSWHDGWPMCGHQRKTVLAEDGPLLSPQESPRPFVPDLTQTSWEPEWIFLRRPDWQHHRRVPGAMLLTPSQQTLRDPTPTFAAVRPADFDCVTDAVFTFEPGHEGDEAGLAVRLDSRFHITCTLGFGRVLTLALQAEDLYHVAAQTQIGEGEIRLRLTADRERYVFSVEKDGVFIPAGSVSTRFLATEFQGRCFTGTVIGLYCTCQSPTSAVMKVTAFTHRIS